VDAAGDVFILNQGTGNTATTGTGSVIEVPNVAGVLTNSAQKTLLTGLNTPTDMVLDGEGSMYITLTGSNEVVQVSNASLDSGDVAMVPHGYGLSAPTGLALDTSGNIYVADTGNNRVLEIGDGFQNSVGNSLTAPTGVAVDPSGSVVIADGSGRIVRVPNEQNPNPKITSGLNQADQQVLASPLLQPYSIRLDASGNLYASDMQNGALDQLVRTTGAVNFGDWNLNTVSDTQTLVLSNIGDTTITLGTPLFTPIPSATGFSVTAGTGNLACASGAFYPGYACNLGATFAPTVAGPSTYPLVLAAAAQNTAAPTINLIGNGVSEDAATVNIVQTAPTGTITYGEPITFTANVVPTASGGPTPTGHLVFTFDGQVEQPKTLSGGSAVLNLPAQNAGSHTISAYYEGDSNYAEAKSSVLPVNITLASSLNVLTIVGDSADPLSSAPSHTLVMTDTLTPSVVGLFQGTVTFTNTLTPNAAPLAVVTLGSPDPKTGNYIASFTYQNTGTSGLALGGYNIIATYSGNSNYFGNTSNAVPFTVSNPTFTLTPSATSVTSTRDNYGSINVTVTDYSNFQAGVSFTCTGLPANAYCVFRPDIAQLLPALLITPNTIYPVTSVLQFQVDQSLSVVEGGFGWVGALLSLVFLVAWRRKVPTRRFKLLSACLLLCMGGLVSLSGCGSGSSGPTTPSGTYPVVVTATATPLLTNGSEPPCESSTTSTTCNTNVVQQFTVNLTVK
jgi:sugar lactone lactonase YvrE